ncbi:hypothetical protein A0J61_02425 [Choanephora cucurbitarum]|uniref:Uncharacterized protein n=1 Tax=Choanephora cucurbitarum TaxID=101091 RepID=A0A1C7NL27_9FUNG|nr:hypothetical protein A0J61_02425 [Choanephora cucurbitarum]
MTSSSQSFDTESPSISDSEENKRVLEDEECDAEIDREEDEDFTLPQFMDDEHVERPSSIQSLPPIESYVEEDANNYAKF